MLAKIATFALADVDPYGQSTMIAGWVSAMSTTMAAVLAGVAGAVAYRLYKVESLRDQEARDERRARLAGQRQGQASKVCGWYHFRSDEPAKDGSPHYSYGVHVLNTS